MTRRAGGWHAGYGRSRRHRLLVVEEGHGAESKLQIVLSGHRTQTFIFLWRFGHCDTKIIGAYSITI